MASAAVAPVIVIHDKDEEEQQVLELMEWMEARGFPTGELYHEVSGEASGGVRAVLDLAWPAGVQEGLSQPVSILLNETSETEEVANAVGHRFFTDIQSFKVYVEADLMGGVAAADYSGFQRGCVTS